MEKKRHILYSDRASQFFHMFDCTVGAITELYFIISGNLASSPVKSCPNPNVLQKLLRRRLQALVPKKPKPFHQQFRHDRNTKSELLAQRELIRGFDGCCGPILFPVISQAEPILFLRHRNFLSREWAPSNLLLEPLNQSFFPLLYFVHLLQSSPIRMLSRHQTERESVCTGESQTVLSSFNTHGQPSTISPRLRRRLSIIAFSDKSNTK